MFRICLFIGDTDLGFAHKTLLPLLSTRVPVPLWSNLSLCFGKTVETLIIHGF